MTVLHTVDTGRMREHNSSLLLNMIWREQQISRAELARRTGLSRSTVSEIVNDLLATGLVRESGSGDSSGGRRPTILRFNDDAFVLAGVEMGATHVHVSTTDLRGRPKHSRQRSIAVVNDPKGTLKLIREFLGECLEEDNVSPDRLLGIGVAVPCPVDLAEPDRLHPRLMPKWKGVSVIDALRRAYDCPVYVDNDANLGAIAEKWWGAGKAGEDLAYIKVATGVGAGLILSGELYRGSGGTSGEIGHTAIDPRGPRCRCGLSGCLAAMIGTQALVERAGGKAGTTIESIVESALSGHAGARAIIGEAGGYLGIAVANLLNLLNPAVVVLGGHITSAGDLLLDPIRETVHHRTLWKSVAEARIVTSVLGEASIAVGGATLVLQAALKQPALFPASRRARAG